MKRRAVALDKARRLATTAHTGEAPEPSCTCAEGKRDTSYGLTAPVDPRSGSVGHQLVGVRKYQIAGGEIQGPQWVVQNF